MKILQTSDLSPEQKRDIEALIHLCREHRPLRLEFPFCDASLFCLLYDPQLVCALALLLPQEEDEPAECVAFTRPDRRRSGCFFSLFQSIADQIEDRDLLFPADHTDPDTLAALAALETEEIATEYRLELDLAGASPRPASAAPGASVPRPDPRPQAAWNEMQRPPFQMEVSDTSPNRETSILTFSFYLDKKGAKSQEPDALCRTTLFPGSQSACFYDFSVHEPLRGRGLGSLFLPAVFPHLRRRGIRFLSLHVSGENQAALALYKKTGFRVTETLSYYLY